MLAICIEASHSRGMGHLFRSLNFIEYLKGQAEDYLVLVNNDEVSCKILREYNVQYEVIDFEDEKSNWEKTLIHKYSITMWMNDKFESSKALCKHVKEENILLAVIDDRGEGAKYADLHFAGMLFAKKENEILGKRVFCGLKYNILNSEIELYRRKREKLERIVVTLGGSDTYGVTIQVINILKKFGWPADIIVGANFQHNNELMRVINEDYRVFRSVPSLMKLFEEYDLAITGGGVTCIEANAAGLPCVIVANEIHEIDTGKYMEKQGGAVFAGYYKELKQEVFKLDKLNIREMSIRAMEKTSLHGCENIYHVLKKYEKNFTNA